MGLSHFLTFASDAELMAFWGVVFLTIAPIAYFAERRRVKRERIDRVGWMPWSGIFLASAVAGLGLLAMSIPAMRGG